MTAAVPPGLSGVVQGVPLIVGVGAGAAAVLLCAGLGIWMLARSRRAARQREERLAAEQARSQAELAALRRRLEELSDEVRLSDRMVRESRPHPEYLITSLAPAGELPGPGVGVADRRRAGNSELGAAVEQRLVGALARRDGAGSGRVVSLVLRTVALGHGVRRALSPDVLDRAAAEAHVARRRSRRNRRREMREARRLVRDVRRNAA